MDMYARIIKHQRVTVDLAQIQLKIILKMFFNFKHSFTAC